MLEDIDEKKLVSKDINVTKLNQASICFPIQIFMKAFIIKLYVNNKSFTNKTLINSNKNKKAFESRNLISVNLRKKKC